jgi:arylsulfatase A-like enzyme
MTQVYIGIAGIKSFGVNAIILLSTLLFILFPACSENKDKIVANKNLPNIVYIFADDLGYGDLGCYGAKDIRTPYLDSMAGEGILFSEFYSASSVCSPSRAALLTGRIPQRMGINQVFFPESFTGMPPSEITIAELLKGKGYATGIVGKWHLGHHLQFLPLQQGFDTYFGIPYSNDMRSVVYMRDNKMVEDSVDQRMTTKRYTAESLKFIDQHRNHPFYLYLAYNMPHVPIYASGEFIGSSQRGLYGDVIQEIDWSVGQILNKLAEHGLLENTLIVFSSDNGPWLAMKEHGGSAGILREGKQYTFEGGLRVPTLAMWKGKIAPNRIYSRMATQMDWFPTIAAIADIKIPTDRPIDGRDLSEVLFNEGAREADTFLYFDGDKLEGYRKGDYKVKLPYQGFSGAPWKKAVAPHDTLLINLKEDPGELKNLYSSNPELARALLTEMEMELEVLGPLPPSINIGRAQDNSHYDYLMKKRNKELE